MIFSLSQLLANASVSSWPEIHLPKPNQFIATNFEVFAHSDPAESQPSLQAQHACDACDACDGYHEYHQSAVKPVSESSEEVKPVRVRHCLPLNAI